MNTCPCGSGSSYADCCQLVINGKRPAETAEQLMRARYAAFVNAEMDFIFESTHPDHRDGYDHAGTKAWAEKSEWLGLDIVQTRQGGPEDATGEVEFIARFRDKGVRQEHHERGRFKRIEDRWYFFDGETVKPKQVVSSKVGRNEPCPCGSGKKFKKCCGK